MKLLLTILLLSILTSCAPINKVPGKWFSQTGRLVSVKMQDRSHAVLSLVTIRKDSIKVLWGSTGTVRPRWVIGTWYQVKCDSSDYRLIDGHRYYLAALKRLD
jgi:hypothetical protein